MLCIRIMNYSPRESTFTFQLIDFGSVITAIPLASGRETPLLQHPTSVLRAHGRQSHQLRQIVTELGGGFPLMIPDPELLGVSCLSDPRVVKPVKHDQKGSGPVIRRAYPKPDGQRYRPATLEPEHEAAHPLQLFIRCVVADIPGIECRGRHWFFVRRHQQHRCSVGRRHQCVVRGTGALAGGTGVLAGGTGALAGGTGGTRCFVDRRSCRMSRLLILWNEF